MLLLQRLQDNATSSAPIWNISAEIGNMILK